MATTIQVSAELRKTLEDKKIVSAESYEEVIWSLIEDTMSLNQETINELKKAEADIKAGKFITHEQMKKELGL